MQVLTCSKRHSSCLFVSLVPTVCYDFFNQFCGALNPLPAYAIDLIHECRSATDRHSHRQQARSQTLATFQGFCRQRNLRNAKVKVKECWRDNQPIVETALFSCFAVSIAVPLIEGLSRLSCQAPVL